MVGFVSSAGWSVGYVMMDIMHIYASDAHCIGLDLLLATGGRDGMSTYLPEHCQQASFGPCWRVGVSWWLAGVWAHEDGIYLPAHSFCTYSTYYDV